MNYIVHLAGLIRIELGPDSLPDEPVDELLRYYAVLALAVGSSIRAEDVHNAWVSWMIARDPDHPALVPYGQLDPETAIQDEPFVRAIRSVVAKNPSLMKQAGVHGD